MQEIIRAQSISKRFGSVTALREVSLTAHDGETLGVFGLSCAGKSTLVRILGGIVQPDSGKVDIGFSGVPTAVWFDHPAVDPELTVFETLWLNAALYNIPRGRRRSAIRDVLALVNLDEARNQRPLSFSEGMLRRLEAARALLSPSPLLVADEPMSGLDYRVRTRIWNHLMASRSYTKQTMVIATSRPEDAELCDRIVLLHEGTILATGTLAQLRSLVGPQSLVVTPLVQKGARTRSRGGGITAVDQEGSLLVEFGERSRPMDVIRQLSGDISAVRLRPRSLDSVLDELISRDDRVSDGSDSERN